MSGAGQSSSTGFIRRLRRARMLILHPEDQDRKVLFDQLRRIGCQTECLWPPPNKLPEDYDVVFFLLSGLEDGHSVTWLAEGSAAAHIAIIAYETPDILEEISRRHVHGVLSKPLRIFGVLAAITTALGMAQREGRLKQRIRTLDDTLRARRQVEQAVRILSRERGITEEEAYVRIREKSMKSQKPIAEIAEAIIAAAGL
jgi:AmiR/NasT family two-component response regulator